MKVSYGIWLIFLLLVSIQDLKKQSISTKMLLFMGILGTLIQCFEKSITLGSWFGGIGLGVFSLFLAFATREGIGYGDGWLIVVMGMTLGFQFSMLALLVALGISALASGCLLVFKRVRRNYRVPFAPFLFAACLFCFKSYGG